MQQQVFFHLLANLQKGLKKIRDALVPIGILQLLLQACGREDGDEVQHGSRFLAITNDADVNWLNHKRCGRCSQCQLLTSARFHLHMQDPHPKIQKITRDPHKTTKVSKSKWMLGTQTHEILCCRHLSCLLFLKQKCRFEQSLVWKIGT